MNRNELALDVNELTVSYGGLLAVSGASINVAPGEVVGLIGPNGAGKTSLIDAITGFTSSRGRIAVDGVSVTGLSAHRRTRLGLSRTFQSVELFDDLTVSENLLVAASDPTWWSPLIHMIAPNFGRGNGAMDVEWALDAVGLSAFGESLPTSLSHGQRRLVGVARALVRRPKVILLDEPAAGLDTQESKLLGIRIKEISATGIGVLLVDHDMGLVLSTCDRIAVLNFGEIIAVGTPVEIRNNKLVLQAYLGTARSEA
ncbi:MAG: ABC transporter ATP-binding protein [Acidimicrobiia bacterium]|nr:ABC transporter ATP-binding protein [Acidimicrobiia bacterium]MBJ7512926.1 ABC transporter ATP-binding protein [Acidimicrobiia bacterium]